MQVGTPSQPGTQNREPTQARLAAHRGGRRPPNGENCSDFQGFHGNLRGCAEVLKVEPTWKRPPTVHPTVGGLPCLRRGNRPQGASGQRGKAPTALGEGGRRAREGAAGLRACRAAGRGTHRFAWPCPSGGNRRPGTPHRRHRRRPHRAAGGRPRCAARWRPAWRPTPAAAATARRSRIRPRCCW